MPKKDIYPEYDPVASFELTDQEKTKLAESIVAGWDAGNIPTWQEQQTRCAYAVNNAKDIDAARKKEIRNHLYLVNSVDDGLFIQKEQMESEINAIMQKDKPGSKQDLISKIGSHIIPKQKFVDKYMQFKCQKSSPTWKDFKDTYQAIEQLEVPIGEM